MTSRTLWTGAFWKAAAERAIKTAAQVLILALGGDVVSSGFDVAAADWAGAGKFAAGGIVLSVLTSIVSDAATGGGPSLVNAEVLATEEA